MNRHKNPQQKRYKTELVIPKKDTNPLLPSRVEPRNAIDLTFEK
jgi:hypothetical protein